MLKATLMVSHVSSSPMPGNQDFPFPPFLRFSPPPGLFVLVRRPFFLFWRPPF